MKKIMMMLIAVLLTAATMAQPGNGRKMHGKMNGGRDPMTNLQLTEAQKTQMQELRTQLKQEMKQLMENESITVKQQRDQREAMAKAHRQKMEKILTKAQLSQLKASKEAQMAKAKEMQVKRIEKMGTILSFTDEQKEKAKANQLAHQQALKAIHDDKQMDRTARKEAFDKLKENMKTDMDKLLTDAQKTQLKALKTQFPGNKGRKHFGQQQGVAK